MTLGNVGKASSNDFTGKRKVLLIPYVVATREAQELEDLVASYWEEAIAQVRKLEAALGPVRHIFHEGSVGRGEEATKALEMGNPVGYPHLQAFVSSGATLEPTEDPEALNETLDLHRCLAVVQSSHRVLHRLVEWFEESRKSRYTAIARNIDTTLPPDGVALLVISPDHEVQFPKDIQVVYIAPPALDKINRWLRDHRWDEAPAGAADEPGTGRASPAES